MFPSEMDSGLDGLHQLGPRALAAVLRRLVLPLEIWVKDGAYKPFVEIFSRVCNAAESWYALGHDPAGIKCIELDGVESRGTPAEMQIWSTIWSASRAMEFARKGQLHAAYSQFRYTIETTRMWKGDSSLDDASQKFREHAEEYVANVASIVQGHNDPPLDSDALAIPRFYHEGPKGPNAETKDSRPVEFQDLSNSTQTASRLLSFDAEVNELIRLVAVGRVAVFCGAGISIASGIPAARPLRAALLQEMPASQREVFCLTECELPFEAFMESLQQDSDFSSVFEVFAGSGPSGVHLLLAELVSRGLLQTIVTTNFDELIERSLAERAVSYRVFWRQDDVADTENGKERTRVVKLHGTLSEPKSLALTMEQIAGQQFVLSRKQALQDLFVHGNHDAVLVVGYSCSDVFDITPHIEALSGPHKRVYFVEHTTSVMCAEKIQLKQQRNPFRRFDEGTRLVCDTNVLLERLSHRFVADRVLSFQSRATDKKWRTLVKQWWNSIPTADRVRIGHTILGRIWYRCSDYRAAKAHYRAALAEATPRIVWPVLGELASSFMFARPGADHLPRCAALLAVGGCHRALSEYPQAMECFKEALGLARLSHDESAEAEASAGIGTVLFNTGNFAEAAQSYERSIKIWERLGGHSRSLGTALANLGNTYGAMANPTEALKCFNRAVEIAREFGDKSAEGARLGGASQAYLLMGKLDEADASSRSALEIALAFGDRTGLAHQLGFLAMIQERRGDLTKALEESVRAAALFEELGDRQGEARAIGNAGSYCLRLGRINEAIDCLVRSLEIAVVIGDTSVLGVALRHLEIIVGASSAPAPRTDRAKALLEGFRHGHRPDVLELRDILRELATRTAS